MNSDKDKALARKLRFSKTLPDHYGSISRSNDTRLKDDPQQRVDFFAKIQKTLNGEPNNVDWGIKALRKLRESLLGQPCTQFTLTVYAYSVRVAVKHLRFETYVPAVNHILNTVRFEIKIEECVISEMATYLCLHLAHFNNDLVAAFEVCFKFKLYRLKQTLSYLATNDFVSWRSIYASEPCVGNRMIMSFRCKDMTKRAIDVINCSYFMLDKPSIERWCGCSLDVLNKEFECNWVAKGESVVVKERVSLRRSGRDTLNISGS